MDSSQIIKDEIAKKYESTRAFSRACDIPHGTLVSALNNGIESMSYGRVKKICECLDLDLNSFEPLSHSSDSDKQLKRVKAYYLRLPENKQNKVLEYMKDIS